MWYIGNLFMHIRAVVTNGAMDALHQKLSNIHNTIHTCKSERKKRYYPLTLIVMCNSKCIVCIYVRKQKTSKKNVSLVSMYIYETLILKTERTGFQLLMLKLIVELYYTE